MITKKNIWFLTLFSLVIVLSIYYVTMPNELLIENSIKKEIIDSKIEDVIDIEESTLLVSLRMDAEEEFATEIESLKTILTNSDATIDEKNNAYEKMKSINNIKSEQFQLEEDIEKITDAKVFVKIEKNQVRVVVDKIEHDVKIANQIMRLVQSNYENKMYVSVKFEGTK